MMKKCYLAVLLFICIGIPITFGPAVAQDDAGGTPITFTGAIESMEGAMMTVSGIVVNIGGLDAALVSVLSTGLTVEVSGSLEGGVVTAQFITLITTEDSDDEDGGQAATLNGYLVTYTGFVFDGTTTSYSYVVSGTGQSPALSHFDIAIPQCAESLNVTAYSPTDAVSFGTDPTTGINGIKWDLPLGENDSRTYVITFAGEVPEGRVLAAVKGGPGFEAAALPGPACHEPALSVEKTVSVDGGVTWVTADTAPGPEIEPGSDVFFRFTITNTGTSPLTDFTITDSVYDASACAVPAALEPDASFDCTIGPFPAEDEQHSNTVTVTAMAGDTPLTHTANGHYFGGELPEDETELPTIIVIEGPVTAININIITIYDIDIVVAEGDPILTTIQIGDFIRVEGDYNVSENTIIIVAVNIIFVNVDVVVGDDGAVWRDDGNCSNPPPPWAPANGWRRKCEGGGGNDNGNNGRGNNKKNDDDD